MCIVKPSQGHVNPIVNEERACAFRQLPMRAGVATFYTHLGDSLHKKLVESANSQCLKSKKVVQTLNSPRKRPKNPSNYAGIV